MKFVYPEFLYALFAIAIPIIIHLFNFRKFKRVYFSNVSFLKEVKEQTQSQSKLKHLLVLLSRILAISFLVLAFAQPYFPTNNTLVKKGNLVGIYIDNSYSMENTGEVGNLLTEAKLKATEVVKAYSSSDKFIICDNNFGAKSQRILSQEDALETVESITISSKTRKTSSCTSRIIDAFANKENEPQNRSLYLISDFQVSTTNLDETNLDTISTYIIPIKSNLTSNLYIDSVWFEEPTHRINQQEVLQVKIKNNSESEANNIPIKLFLNNQLITPSTFSLAASSDTTINLKYINKFDGIVQGKLSLRDNPVTFDDNYFFSYQINTSIAISEIKKGTATDSTISSIYSTDSLFKLNVFDENNIDYSLVSKGNLIILNGLNEISGGLSSNLKKYVDLGVNLVVIPGTNIDLNSYKECLSLLEINYFNKKDTTTNKVESLNFDHQLFANVFEGTPTNQLLLPQVYNHYQLSKNNNNYKTSVAILKNKTPLISHYKKQNSNIYLFSTNLDSSFSDLKNHAILLPIFYNMALYSQEQFPLAFTIGKNQSININKTDNQNIFKLKNNTFEVIPKVVAKQFATTIFLDNGIENADNYTLSNNNFKTGISFNFNRNESDLTTYNVEDLESEMSKQGFNFSIIDNNIETISASIRDASQDKNYWKLCIILALVFLAIEILLLKLLK